MGMTPCQGGDLCRQCPKDFCPTIDKARKAHLWLVYTGKLKQADSIEQLEQLYPGKV